MSAGGALLISPPAPPISSPTPSGSLLFPPPSPLRQPLRSPSGLISHSTAHLFQAPAVLRAANTPRQQVSPPVAPSPDRTPPRDSASARRKPYPVPPARPRETCRPAPARVSMHLRRTAPPLLVLREWESPPSARGAHAHYGTTPGTPPPPRPPPDLPREQHGPPSAPA